MIDFNRGTFNKKPFNYFEIEDVFDEETLEKLINEFPDVSSTKSVMGGRRKLEGKLADNWLKEANTWKKFYDFINSQETLNFVINKYKSELKYWKGFIDSNTKISDCTVHMDWSMAEDGYVREIHRDSDPRIWNFLIFLNNKKWEGGDFQIHSSDNVGYFKQHFWHKHLPITKTVAAKKNYGVFFLSTPDSYHSVSEQFNTLEPRKFIYGSITFNKKTFHRKMKDRPNLINLSTDLLDEVQEYLRKIKSRVTQ